MSSALAIAGVTQVLKDLLNDGVVNKITTATGATVNVTALPPDLVDANEKSQLNLYMYQATFNQGWRNEGLPAYNNRGDRVGNPPLALDLHYLLSAYTGGPQLHTEILLGYGMQLFHENAVLSRDAINLSLNPPDSVDLAALPPLLQALSVTGLADQIELIKITPEIMNPEEMSKLWTAFSAKYRPTAAYKVSVVLIQSTQPTKTSLPVQERKIYAIPFFKPVINEINSIPGAGEPILTNQLIFSGSSLLLKGTQFMGDQVVITIGGIDIIPSIDDISDTKIQVQLPPGLKAGLQSVQVVHNLLIGSPPALHKGVSSNVQAFVLSPLIIADGVANGTTTAGIFKGGIAIKVSPVIMYNQAVRLLLNDLSTANNAYVFDIQGLILSSPPGEDISIPVHDVASGTYLIRIQVDSAESQLLVNINTGQYNGPKVLIP
ncbi:MAG: hypothetical protein JWR05_173 [Mucilaginibacter sp.]|nr:hypothetical protein [Mucilaginibacter sp.]